MKEKFTFSKSNKIYFGVIVALSFVLFVAFSDKTPYQAGVFSGKLIVFLLFPSLFAWIVWRFSGRKEVASLTFNTVLTIVLMLWLLGQIGQLGNEFQRSQVLRELHEQKEEFKKEISNTDNKEKIDDALNKYSGSVKDQLNRLSETSTESEEQFYRIMSDFVTEAQAITQNWSESFNAVQSPRILDYSLLNSDEEFDYQKNILRLYVERTKVYNEFVTDMAPNIKKRLIVLGEGNKNAKEAVEGLTEKYLLQKPIFEPLMQAHVEYGKNLIDILKLLQENKNEWVYENDKLLIYSASALKKYNELIEEVVTNEGAINTLSGKLFEGF